MIRPTVVVKVAGAWSERLYRSRRRVGGHRVRMVVVVLDWRVVPDEPVRSRDRSWRGASGDRRHSRRGQCPRSRAACPAGRSRSRGRRAGGASVNAGDLDGKALGDLLVDDLEPVLLDGLGDHVAEPATVDAGEASRARG